MNRVIRAKIKIDSVRVSRNTNKVTVPEGTEGEKVGEQINASAVYSEDKTTENYSFSVATPSLSFQMYINNPGAFDTLIQGKEYYLDFTPCEDATPNPFAPSETSASTEEGVAQFLVEGE